MDTESPTPPADPVSPTTARGPSRQAIVGMVLDQAWGLCVAYLLIGLGAEVARRLGVPAALSLQEFLDGLPLFAIRQAGFIEHYLRASALETLGPFWNRMLLSSVAVGIILAQATVVATITALSWSAVLRRRAARRDGK